jgi:hypothetical protein
VLLRLDPKVHDALARWAADELRSGNAQIEYLLRRALAEAGRLPTTAAPIPRRGRPPKSAEGTAEGTDGTGKKAEGTAREAEGTAKDEG